jgi:putative FmdB family regulatory protein
MPTYEYVCQKCGHHFEQFQPISDPPLTSCPQDHCKLKRWGKGAVKRSISGGGGLIFKGSGFYVTDYRSDSYKEAAKKDSGSDPKPATTKPEPATTATPKPETKPSPKNKSP